jgi:hypothetical protein
MIDRVAELNNKGIQLEKDGDIQGAIQVYEENIRLEYPATHSYERLMVLYRKNKDVQNEKRVIEIAIKVFSNANKQGAERAINDNPELEKEILSALTDCKRVIGKNGMYCFIPSDIFVYQNRLKKIENGVLYEEISFPIQSTPFNVDGVPLGIQFENIIKLLPEFNFYVDLSENENTNDYLYKHRGLVNDEKHKLEIWRIQNLFNSLITDAERYETIGLLDKAAVVYEQIIAEKYFLHTPYDRLIKIYSKAKLKSDERRVLEFSIKHFTELKNRQKEYVIQLATKYGKLDFANDRINNNKKISYYGGAFELYNPYPIIETWVKRLSKLK